MVRYCVWGARACVLALVILAAPALLAAEKAAPGKGAYPRSLGEMKAILSLLEPARPKTIFEAMPAGWGAGRLTPAAQEAFLRRMQQYRFLCGVAYEDLSIDEEYAKLAQHAALVCAKLNQMTHTPTKPAGMPEDIYQLSRKGAGESNLYTGLTDSIACVDGWMDDSDTRNIDRVGHRRWIINPYMTKSAFGRVGDYAAMYAFDSARGEGAEWDHVAYPCRGYMPLEFFGARHAWSVSLNKAHYKPITKGTVRVTLTAADASGNAAGEPLKFDYFNVETSNYGCGPCIIFRPAALALKEGKYRVKIDGLQKVSGALADFSYLVHFVKIKDAPDGPEAQTASTAFMEKRLAAVMALDDKAARLTALVEFSEHPALPRCDAMLAAKVRHAVTELTKEPELRKEMEARQTYRRVQDFEAQAGGNKDKLAQAGAGYRDLAARFKDTRAGKLAQADFERIKGQLGL